MTIFWCCLASSSNVVISRFAPLMSELGGAKPGAMAAAGAATVGVAGVARGCGNSMRVASKVAGAVGQAGKTEQVVASATGPLSRLAAVGRAEEVVDGARASGMIIEHPAMRVVPTAELQENLLGEYKSFPRPLLLAGDSNDLRLGAIVTKEPVTIYDSTGNVIRRVPQSAEQAFRAMAQRALDDVIQNIPPTEFKSEAELRAAFAKSFERSHRAEYSFDVGSGKLKLKFKTKNGELTGEIDTYDVAKKLAASSLGGWIAHQVLTNHPQPSQGSLTVPSLP
jgi:hypothetical protein